MAPLDVGETCNVNKDPKHPARWHRAYLYRTVGDEHMDFKQEILKMCQTRGDKWADCSFVSKTTCRQYK